LADDSIAEMGNKASYFTAEGEKIIYRSGKQQSAEMGSSNGSNRHSSRECQLKTHIAK
jgi:hypothetical protein